MVKMIGYDRLQTLVIYLYQLLATKIHSNFNLKNKITKFLQSS